MSDIKDATPRRPPLGIDNVNDIDKDSWDVLRKKGKGKKAEEVLANAKLLVVNKESNIIVLYATINDLRALGEHICLRNGSLEFQLENLQTDYDWLVDTYKEMEGVVADNDDKILRLQQLNQVANEKAADAQVMCTRLAQQLAYEQEQLVKAREECHVAARDMATMREDLVTKRQERDSMCEEMLAAKEELERLRLAAGGSLKTTEALSKGTATMEAQAAVQAQEISALREQLATEKQSRDEAVASALSEALAQVVQLQAALADAEKTLAEGECIRRKLHDELQNLKGTVRAYCRVRPFSSTEMGDPNHATKAFEFPTSAELKGRGVTVTTSSSSVNGTMGPSFSFQFERVYDEGATQDSIFKDVSELVQSALDGQKVTIFAYGQTGSGKTFTMLGDQNNPGIVPRAVCLLFATSQKLGAQHWRFSFQVSVTDIYMDKVRDLLSPGEAGSGSRKATHGASSTVTLDHTSMVSVDGPEAVHSLLAQATARRAVGVTALNEQSSRSHVIVTFRISGENTCTGDKVSGVLNLVDLAGSERVKQSGVTGEALKEAQAINKSLSTLGTVISQIASKDAHVSFRDSKLTTVLQPCLGGNAKALMFASVAPSS